MLHQLGNLDLTTLLDAQIPFDTQELSLGTNNIESLEGLPQGLKKLYLGTNKITSLEGIPQGLETLCLGSNRITIPEHLPHGLATFCVCHNRITSFSLLIMAAQCGQLTCVNDERHLLESVTGWDELQALVAVPLNKRPARVVLAVLSSSSVPRVGTRAAVRRLHRADLVREMAGMLG